MRALPSLLHVLVTFAALTSTCGAGAEEDTNSVGTVNKVQNEAQVISASGAITAAVVHMKDELRTGANARLQVTFRDNTLLTLGEHASVVIDRYVYDPDRSVGETALQATKGAFRFATSRIEEMKDHKIAVSTPVADIGVRGTEFWGGPLEKYGVLLLEGEVIVSNQAGSVVLAKSGQGTDIASALDPPGEPKAWPEEKVARAPPSPCTDRWE
jgi:FecR protein